MLWNAWLPFPGGWNGPPEPLSVEPLCWFYVALQRVRSCTGVFLDSVFFVIFLPSMEEPYPNCAFHWIMKLRYSVDGLPLYHHTLWLCGTLFLCLQRHYVFRSSVRPSMPFSWTRYLRNCLKKFLQIWHKCPIGLKDGPITLWWSNVKVTVTWNNTFLAKTQEFMHQLWLHFTQMRFELVLCSEGKELSDLVVSKTWRHFWLLFIIEISCQLLLPLVGCTLTLHQNITLLCS